jgi:hypothetical protein
LLFLNTIPVFSSAAWSSVLDSDRLPYCYRYCWERIFYLFRPACCF